MKRALLILVLLASSCRTLPFPEPRLEGDYGTLLRKWTREVALYSGLETRAFAQVVYLSPQMVEAQAAQISALRAEPAPQRARTFERERANAATPSFFAVVRTPDRNWNDWESKTSVWRIAIDYGAGQFEPERVERIERPFNAELQTLYPYLDEYSVAYVIHFPAASAPPPPPASAAEQTLPRLVVAGALGKMIFDWTHVLP